MGRFAVIEYILGTDMANHFDYLSRFRLRVADETFLEGSMEDRRVLNVMTIKAADLSHSALPWELHQLWSFRCACEFFFPRGRGTTPGYLGVPALRSAGR